MSSAHGHPGRSNCQRKESKKKAGPAEEDGVEKKEEAASERDR